MHHILVPLDGSDLAASILPDAIQVAGPDGEIILIRDASKPAYDSSVAAETQSYAVEVSEAYLEMTAASLAAQGMNVRAETFVMGTPVRAIDEAAHMYAIDMIACATHGRTGLQRLLRGSVAWTALAHSSVPVLLRRPAERGDDARGRGPMRILVPLDGSKLAESALPIAQKLSSQLDAPIWLVRVVQDVRLAGNGRDERHAVSDDNDAETLTARDYLDSIARRLPVDVDTSVLLGPATDTLVEAAKDAGVTHIVMASHGRTGLSRVILGSVTDGLVHRRHCPIIVVPALVAIARVRESKAEKQREGAPIFA